MPIIFGYHENKCTSLLSIYFECINSTLPFLYTNIDKNESKCDFYSKCHSSMAPMVTIGATASYTVKNEQVLKLVVGLSSRTMANSD